MDPPGIPRNLPGDAPQDEAGITDVETKRNAGDDEEKQSPIRPGKENEYDSTAESDTSTASNKEEAENPNRPKGIRFVLLFSCVLLGCFVVGYVCIPI